LAQAGLMDRLFERFSQHRAPKVRARIDLAVF
jgi:hypothetical protein